MCSMFFGKCLYLGIYSAYSYRQLNGAYLNIRKDIK